MANLGSPDLASTKMASLSFSEYLAKYSAVTSAWKSRRGLPNTTNGADMIGFVCVCVCMCFLSWYRLETI